MIIRCYMIVCPVVLISSDRKVWANKIGINLNITTCRYLVITIIPIFSNIYYLQLADTLLEASRDTCGGVSRI